MESFDEMVKIKKEIQDVGKLRYKEESKIRLAKILTKKIQTTMIGALASVEANFGFLWEPGENELSAKQFEELYEKTRQEILDNGNNQIRNFKLELEQYSVEWLRYKLSLPVKTRED